MKQKFILSLFLLLQMAMFAQSFTTGNLRYTVTTGTKVSVEKTLNCPQGVLTIPNFVTYGGTTYAVTSIDLEGFAFCSGITSVIIPNSVTSIGQAAFYNCLFMTSITIPNSVTSIGNGAFYGCFNLASITIPNSVTSIGQYAFQRCQDLTSIIIPSSVTSIAEGTFRECISLTSITIPNSVTSIGFLAFFGCTSLTSITIPNSVTSIGNSAFASCTDLTSILIPSSITSISSSTFRDCTSLTSITIPNSVTSIGSFAFDNCSSLASIVIPNSVTAIGPNTFYNCSNLNSITIPNSVTSIGDSTFSGCSSLTSIVIPSSITSINANTFRDCINLNSITIPNSVTSVGQNAFLNCLSLTSITIPSAVTSIGQNVFFNCSSLTSVTCEIVNPLVINTNVFQNVALSNATLYVPTASIMAYQSAAVWQNFGNIQSFPSATHLNFDGQNDYVALSNNVSSSLSGGSEMTIEYWFKGTKVQSAVRFQGSTGGYIIAGWNANGGNPKFIISTDGATTNGVECGSTSIIESNTWHHLAFVWKKNQVFATYLDGVLQNSRVAANVNLPTFSGSVGFLGQRIGGTQLTNGNLDEVRIWNVARTATQINSSKNCELIGNETGLLAYYQFNQGRGGVNNAGINSLIDTSSNGNNGTLHNFALGSATSNWLSGSVVTSGLTVPLSPIAEAQTFAIGATIANLTPPPSATIKWYDVATGGTALDEDATLATNTYYVSESNANDCESERTMVSIAVFIPPNPPTSKSPQIYAGEATIANLIATGSNLQWYSTSTGGSALDNTTLLENGSTYYVSQTTNGLQSARTAVVVNSISEATQEFCETATLEDIVITPSAGASVSWFTEATGGTALVNTTVLNTGNYYIEQSLPFTINTLGSGFNKPYSVAVQADGKILIADSNNNSIKRMNADGSEIETLGNGFNNPRSVALQADGKILVADRGNNAIKRMNSDGSGIETLGSGFSFPNGVAVQTDGKILVVDTGNNSIKRMNANGTSIETLGGGFNSPTGVAIQANGWILVADQGNNAIKRINANGTIITTLGNGFSNPYGVALQANGQILVADTSNDAIKRMNVIGTSIVTLGSGFNEPVGMTVQLDGKILIVDSNNNAIKRIAEAYASNRVAVNVIVNQTSTLSNAGNNTTFIDGEEITLSANNPDSGTGTWSVVSGPSLDVNQFENIHAHNSMFNHNGGIGTYVLRWTINNGACEPSFSEVSITVEPVKWNGTNWNNVIGPNALVEIEIDGNYVSADHGGSITAKKLTVTPNGSLTISNGNHLTLSDALINNATVDDVVIESGAYLKQTENITNVGSITVKRVANLKRLDIALWSSPVASQNLLALSPETLTNRFFSFSESANNWSIVDNVANHAMEVAAGYGVRAPNNWPTTVSPFSGTFKGIPNNGNYTQTFTSDHATARYNLVGNPYPSVLDLRAFYNANEGKIINTFYFYEHTLPPGTVGQTNYGTLTIAPLAADNVYVPASNSPNASNLITIQEAESVEVGQGFFVRAIAGQSGVLNFNNAMRKTTPTVFFRNANALMTETSKFRLEMTTPEGFNNQTVVGYYDYANNDLDMMDAVGLGAPFYTLLNNQKLVSQGFGLPFNQGQVIPLGGNFAIEGTYTIGLHSAQGIFENQQYILLYDSVLGIYHNLSVSPYEFEASGGVNDLRFEIVFTSILTNENPAFKENDVVVYEIDKLLQIHSKGNDLLEAVSIIDLSGRKLLEINEIHKDKILLENFQKTSTILIINTKTINGKTQTHKVFY